jgi:hypothetical protein
MFRSKKDKKKPKEYVHVMGLSKHFFDVCLSLPFIDPNRNPRSTGYKIRAGSTDITLTCGDTSMQCSMMASPETPTLKMMTIQHCTFAVLSLYHANLRLLKAKCSLKYVL